MASAIKNFGISPYFSMNLQRPFQSRYPNRCSSANRDSTVTSTSKVNGAVDALAYAVKEETKRDSKVKDFDVEKLEPLWDDGYGTETVKNLQDYAVDLIKPDGGPPRWFSPVSCGPHLRNSPVLLFLPGMDGLGAGLLLHHKSLGKVFDFRCMHIPVQDRTPFEELVEWVEKAVRIEHSLSPKRPIYLVGDSFGGCLALAVAARNPKVDLVVILANPATSFDRSQFQLFLPLLEALPVDLYPIVPNLLNIFMGDPIKMSSVGIDTLLHPLRYFEKITSNFIAAQPHLSSGLAAVLPKETLVWKLKLLKTGSAYANARLHAVKAEVLILASGKDFVIPSRDEALRLLRSIRNCKIRYFKDNGHTIFLEDGVNLLTIIKSTSTYRHSKNYDYVMDYLPPSMSEFKQVEENAWLRNFVSPVFYSTEEDGKIVKGLSGVPNEGPVILVSYHMFMGLEVAPLLEQFLREKKIMVRGIAHPTLFSQLAEGEFSITDYVTLYGALPVSASNLFKLFAMKSHVLLYPGGTREALHRKGEEYKLFWPDEPEFVRMAARFGATIVPFGVVGEDDIAKLVLDYDDLMKIPFLNERLKRDNEQYKSLNIRAGMSGEVANQPFHLPVAAPKIPGRFYYMFGKPIQTKGRKAMLKDKEKARELYRQIKCDVESNISYLLEKRKEDPYRGLINRAIYRAFRAPMDQVPSFET